MARTTVQKRGRRPEVTNVPMSAPPDLEQALYDLDIEVTGGDDDEVKGRCPYHEFYTGKSDNDPSWSVNRSTGQHNCFSCPYGGSFIGLVCDMLEIGAWDASKWIRQYGLNHERIQNLPEFEERKKPRTSAEVEEIDLADFTNPPQKALECRGISLDSAKFYGILWDEDELSWILPIRTPDGVLIGWQAKGEKRLGGRPDVKNHPKSMRKSVTLFGADVFPIGEPAVVQEAPLDCARILTAGVLGAVATFGDSFSDEQMNVLRDLTDEVVWGTDNDEAGRSAARMFRDGDAKTKRPAHSRRFKSRYLNYGMLPEGCKDVGEPEVADIHILRSIRGAQHALLADLGESDAVYRRAAPVPATSKKADGKPWSTAPRNGTGHRQDANSNRRRRGSGRGIR